MLKKLILLSFMFFINSELRAHYGEDIGILWQKLAKEKNPRNQFLLYNYIFLNHYYHYGTADTIGLVLCQKMEKIADQLDNDTLKSRTYILYDVYYGRSGEYSLCINSIDKAKYYALKAKDYDGLSTAFKEFAILFKEGDMLDAALDNLNQSLYYLNQSKIVDSISYLQPNRLFYNLAEIYYLKKNYFVADSFLQIAEKRTLKLIDPYGQAKLLTIHALVNTLNSDYYKLADTYFKMAIEYCDKEKLYIPKVTACYEYSNFLYKIKSLDSAKKYALICFSFSETTGNVSGLLKSSKQLRVIYELDPERQDSMIYYLKITDSLNSVVSLKDKINRINNAIRENDKTISIENKDKEKREERQQKIIGFFGIAFIVISIIIIFLILSHTVFVSKAFILVMGNLAFLLFFEFVNLILHYIFATISHSFSDYNPVIIEFPLLVIFAAILLPIHHRIQKKITDNLILRNKIARVQNARHILEEETN